MKKYLLYIDILGFSDLVEMDSDKIQSLYDVIDSLNVHRHNAFKAIVFSDTVLVYNIDNASSEEDRDYCVMFACEFVQDLQFRLVGKNIYFRAVLVLDNFIHNSLNNLECYYGKALIKAHNLEKDIQAVGLFIDDESNKNNRIFPTKRFDKDLSFVYLNQSLETLQKNCNGNLLVGSACFQQSYDYSDILWDIGYLKDIYHNMKRQDCPCIRDKYLVTWYLYFERYPKILEALVSNNFSLKSICSSYDWEIDINRFNDSLKESDCNSKSIR